MKYNTKQLIEQIERGEKVEFCFFWGHRPSKDGRIIKSCFSQWWEAPFSIEGVEYKTAEHYMMAGKARLFNDEEMLNQILAADTPNQAKKLGRKVQNFDPQAWDEHKYEIVKQGNLAKFSQNEELKDFLLSTKNEIIVEASPYDKIWGIGMLQDDKNAINVKQWKGENLLGFALMEVRDELKND